MEPQIKILGIIPSRYASTRFPGKPLVEINGKSMVQLVYEQAKQSKLLADVIVATDHPEIYDHVNTFGKVCMTSDKHENGTERCFEALVRQRKQYDFVINIQGDQPFVQPDQIDLLAQSLQESTEIATLVKRIYTTYELLDRNVVKVLIEDGNAFYFGRLLQSTLKHIGIYAYRVDILKQITSLPLSQVELSESLEQMRWLEGGFKIKAIETEFDTVSIDVPEDLKKLNNQIFSK